jgi:hypothetical protein
VAAGLGLSAFAVLGISFSAYAGVIFGWTEQQQAKRINDFARLTPEHFDRTSTVQDDDLETAARIDTSEGYKFKGSFTDLIRSNTFLRAIVHKRTGETAFQVYATLTYTLNWRYFESATFATAEGPVSAPLRVIARDVDCKYGCVYTEDVAFDVTEAFLRDLAKTAGDRPVKPWRFRFKAKNGADWTDDMAPAEAAGLLLAVERYRRDHKLP